MLVELGQSVLTVSRESGGSPRSEVGVRLVLTGRSWGSMDGFEDHIYVLLIPTKEMRTADPHSLVPHKQRIILGAANRYMARRFNTPSTKYGTCCPCFSRIRSSVGPASCGFWEGVGGLWGHILGVVVGMVGVLRWK